MRFSNRPFQFLAVGWVLLAMLVGRGQPQTTEKKSESGPAATVSNQRTPYLTDVQIEDIVH